jgi:hypothetical protein
VPDPRWWKPRLVGRLVERFEVPAFIQERRVLRGIERQAGDHPAGWVYAEPPAERLAAFREDLDSLVGAIQATGTRVILVMPAMRFADSLAGDDERYLTSWRQFFPRATGDVLLDFYRAGSAAVCGVARSRGMQVVDERAARAVRGCHALHGARRRSHRGAAVARGESLERRPGEWLFVRGSVSFMTAMHRYAIVLLLLGFAATALRAQIPGAELTQTQATREALQDLLVRLENAANSSVYSGDVRASARRQAEQVRRRLAEGDFQSGDRIYLQVEAETALTDTFVVRAPRQVFLPGVGAVSLEGVLRAELADHLTRELARFVRNPSVRAQALIRVTVMGGVGTQGFYTVPVDIPLSDLLTAAGGVSGTAQLDRIQITRGDEVLLEGEEVERAITRGMTLDALGIQAGDRFIIPVQTTRNSLAFVQTINIILTLPLTVYGLVRLVQNR